ncbi:O-antigen ligase family protein [Microbacterium aurantiacum]|uniref:O-antigen ligase family protein n=1 Tax=Microbacterium aurantiacum TaxID=162393 RepID=UPI003F490E4A
MERAGGAFLGSVVLSLSLVLFSGAQIIPRDLLLTFLIIVSLVAALSRLKFAPPRWPVTLFFAFAAFSIFWSTNTDSAARAIVTLIAMLMAASATVLHLSPKDILRVVDFTLKMLVSVSVAVALALPSEGIEQRAGSYGAMTGVFVHKNVLGTVLVLALVTHLVRNTITKRPAIFLFWCAAFVYTIIRVQSSTVVVLCAVVAVFVIVVRASTKATSATRLGLVGIGIPAITLASIAIFTSLEQALGLVGRDLTFSGRLKIWEGSWAAAQERLVYGHGWGSVFSPGDPAAEVIVLYARWYVPSAHSGFLTVLLQLGIVGVVLASVAVLTTVVQALKRYAHAPDDYGLWGLAVLLVFIVANIFDSRYDGILLFLLTVISCGIARFAVDAPIAQVRQRG